LRFGLQSTVLLLNGGVKPRDQNVRQDRQSSGAHSIVRQLVCRTGLPRMAFFTDSYPDNHGVPILHFCMGATDA
jgi:hypothetical protein